MDKLPVDNINICILGCVSAGKSTILNSLFCQDLSQSKIKRTTMMPVAFVETKNVKNEINYIKISNEIKKINDEIIRKTENGENLNLKDYGNELIYGVNKLDLDISDEKNITIFDIPGLNDARTKNVYYKYLEQNFHLYNIILLIVDINSGMNTSDEIDILNLIIKNIKLNNKVNKKTKLIVVANKVDDMIFNDLKNELEIGNEEYVEMYEQIKKTIVSNFEKFNIIENFVEIIPLCGLDAHLFRMIKSKGYNYKLSQSQIIRIGVSEYGNKFKLKNIDEQQKMVNDIISDNNFVNAMITLSGFSKLNNLLLGCLYFSGNEFMLENIEYELDKIKGKFDGDYNSDFDNYHFKKIELIYKMKNVNKERYIECLSDIYQELIADCVEICNSNIENIYDYKNYILSYDVFVLDNIKKKIKNKNDYIEIKKVFEDIDINFEIYPTQIEEDIIGIFRMNFINYKIEHEKFNDIIYILHNHHMTENISWLLDLLYSETGNDYPITNLINNYEGIIYQTFEIIKNNLDHKNFIRFIRFLLRHYVMERNVDGQIKTLMLYDKKNEFNIKNWLLCTIDKKNLDENLFDLSYEDSMYDENFTIDRYYLNNLLSN